jgi:hypothetical protein
MGIKIRPDARGYVIVLADGSEFPLRRPDGKKPTTEQIANLSAGAPETDEERERRKKALFQLRAEACALLKLPLPDLDDGRPARARDYRTDMTIRTCQGCFRDIKATDGTMADHGYTINRANMYSTGQRMGSCTGVGHVPYEAGFDQIADMLLAELNGSRESEARLDDLRTGRVHTMEVRDWNSSTGAYTIRTIHRADGYVFNEAIRSSIYQIESSQRARWSSKFWSIPWLRMAIRDWSIMVCRTAAGECRRRKGENKRCRSSCHWWE